MKRRGNCPDEYTELEKVLTYGLYGRPDPKKEERMHLLGQLRERMILVLPENRVKRCEIPEELERALKDIRASMMVVKGTVGVSAILTYERLAKRYGVRMVTVSNPEFKGNTGLVVVSNHAVDLPDSEVFPQRVLH